MKIKLSLEQFRDLFTKYNRADNFTYEAINLIYNHLIDEDDIDIVAICCQYNEMSFDEAVKYFNIDFDEESELIETCVYKYLTQKTFVLGVTDNTILFEVC